MSSASSSAKKSTKGASAKTPAKTSTSKTYTVDTLVGAELDDNGQVLYRVRWKGPWSDTMEPYDNVCHLREDIEDVYIKASQPVRRAMEEFGHIDEQDRRALRQQFRKSL